MVQWAKAIRTGEPEQTHRQMRVFLSYSRKDEVFTRRLADALAVRGYNPDYDQSTHDPANIDLGISAEDEWWERIQQMIAGADVMLIVGSSDLATSKVCAEEIAYARNLGKRIIPLLYRPIDFSRAPPRLSALNFKISFTGTRARDFASALDELCAALDQDVGWYRESARVTGLAARWEKAGRPDELLLTAVDVRAVGHLFERRPSGAPEPAAILVELRQASRAKLDAEDIKQRRIVGRAFVIPSQEAWKQNRYEHALRLAATGALLAKDLDFDPKVDTRLWEPVGQAILKNRTLAVLRGHSYPVLAVAFSPDGRRIVTCAIDRTACLWDASTFDQVAQLTGHTGTVLSASFSPDGYCVATASDNTARIWEVETGRPMAKLVGHTGTINTVSFSPNGARVLTAARDGTACLWDTMTGRLIAAFKGHARDVETASFSPDGQRVVTASMDTTGRIWDAVTGQQIVALKGHTSLLKSSIFSPDGQRVATISWDDTARIWNPTTGEVLAVMQGHTGYVNSVDFSPDGRSIVTGSLDGTARIWDITTGEEIAQLTGHGAGINTVAFSADGYLIVTASDDWTAREWTSRDGELLRTLKGHTGPVRSAVFSPDGHRVLTASDDYTARFWGAPHYQDLVGDRATVLTAALACGVGLRSDPERTELLMQDAPDDLYAEARRQLLDPQKYSSEQIASREWYLKHAIADLRAKHDNRHLSYNEFNNRLLPVEPPPAKIDSHELFDASSSTILTGSRANKSTLWWAIMVCFLVLLAFAAFLANGGAFFEAVHNILPRT